jgi:hypothetical protein
MELPADTLLPRSTFRPDLSNYMRVFRALFSLICVLLLAFVGFRFAFGQDSVANTEDKLSRQFTQSATSAMVSIHQVKQSISTILTKNLPSGYYDPALGAQAYEKVRTAQVDATTNGDQQAAILLNSYFTKLKDWAEKHKSDRQSMNATNTMGQDWLSQDSDWQTIEACEKALNTVLIDRVYKNIPSCQ